MKSPLYYFTILLILLSTTFAQWENVSLPVDYFGHCVDALDANTAVIGSEAFFTNDGGVSWAKLYTNAGYGTAVDIELLNKNTIVMASGSGKIIRTSDLGDTWSVTWEDSNKTNLLNYVEFFDDSNGIAMGEGPLFIHSTNGGVTWFEKGKSNLDSVHSASLWHRVDFINENVGYFSASGVNEGFYKTLDGGVTWMEINFPVEGKIKFVKFYDEAIGLACSSGFVIYSTTDGGATWTEGMHLVNWCLDIEFQPSNPNNVWLSEYYPQPQLHFSNDFAQTRTSYSLHETEQITVRDIVAVDDNILWISCDDGYVFKTTMGGVTATEGRIELPVDYELSQNYPNPFNPTTTISYSLPERSQVEIIIYDILGNKTETLVNATKNAGIHSVTFDASNLSSGIYFYTLKTSNLSEGLSADKAGSGRVFVEARKMILIK